MEEINQRISKRRVRPTFDGMKKINESIRKHSMRRYRSNWPRKLSNGHPKTKKMLSFNKSKQKKWPTRVPAKQS